jgi:hypothetical protein
MSADIEYIDGRDSRKVAEFVRGIERDPPVECTRLLLEIDITIAELVKALNAAGCTISTVRGGSQLIHRVPPEAA